MTTSFEINWPNSAAAFEPPQPADMLIGRVTFGPGLYVERVEPARLPPMCVILLELFKPEGNSAGLYWAGRSNRIEAGERGVEVTYDVHKARRIPFLLRDVAEALAAALNKIPTPDIDGVVSVWRAVEHGFES